MASPRATAVGTMVRIGVSVYMWFVVLVSPRATAVGTMARIERNWRVCTVYMWCAVLEDDTASMEYVCNMPYFNCGLIFINGNNILL